jgi:hypothetical protein
MNELPQLPNSVNARPCSSRREFLERAGTGFGAMAMASLLASESAHASSSLSPLAPKQPHFPVKAQRVIHVFAQGGPSHVDTWDPKPTLNAQDGKSLPNMNGLAYGSPFKFTPKGRSGLQISEVWPKLADYADEMTVIRSMYTDIPAHDVSTVMMNTGSLRIIKPSMGSWLVFGLGTMNQNLPGFISLRPGGNPPGASKNWNSAFLPGVYQGTAINTSIRDVSKMIANIKNPYTSLDAQRLQLDLIHKLNFKHSQKLSKNAALESRLEAYEMAFKMQTEATEVFDVSKEPKKVQERYGTNTSQGRQMLMARRLLERDVRFVQVWAGGWDHHNNLQTALPAKAREVDTPLAALIEDLKERGMLDSTLIVWNGEFGRTVTAGGDGASRGRDHNARAFSTVLIGGGVKGGVAYGKTDEFGARSVENKVHIHDLHATILALLGFDHTKLTYRYNGRDFRLTDNFGNVVKNIIA